MSFRTLILLGAALRTGAAAVGTNLAQPLASGRHRAVACPLQWLPVLLAGAPPTLHRRLASNVFTTKADLRTAVQLYDANETDAIATYGPIAGWDVSAITDMRSLFSGLQFFNADISSWNTSSVTSMYGMFFDAVAFNQPLRFDTSSVTDMDNMFEVRSRAPLLALAN